MLFYTILQEGAVILRLAKPEKLISERGCSVGRKTKAMNGRSMSLLAMVIVKSIVLFNNLL